ncbi:MAG: hypothetical protein OEW15_04610 [Nitrospirota bacterium]|nr:hypothetical protein [Nitrospirota bacterium]
MLKRKQDIRDALDRNDLAVVISAAKEDKKVISLLVRVSYDKETLVGWRAIKAMGLIAREMVKSDPKFLREACRKLLWSLSDESGGIGWSAPELLGEIVSANPSRFTDIVPLIAEVYSVEEDVFRSGVVYALARIAETHPGLVVTQQKIIISSLVDKDPLVRIYGLKLVGLVWDEALRSNAWTDVYKQKVQETVRQLKQDIADAWIYKDTGFSSIMVNDIALIIYNKIS